MLPNLVIFLTAVVLEAALAHFVLSDVVTRNRYVPVEVSVADVQVVVVGVATLPFVTPVFFSKTP